MKVPEIVYAFAQLKDLAGGSLILINRKQTVTDSAISLDTTALYEVALDKILILTNMQVDAQPYSTAKVLQIYAVGAEMTQIARAPEIQTAANGEKVELNWSGEVWIPPGDTVSANASFDAAVSPNTMRVSIHGILIPRGNVQQG